MGQISFLILLLGLISCAKPADPRVSDNPLYGSITTVVSGIETNCENCIILESAGSALRITFTDNGLDECSGEGTLSYLSSSVLVIPENDGEVENWDAQLVGDNTGKSPFCFPDNLNLKITKSSTNYYQVDYNGKYFTIQKLN